MNSFWDNLQKLNQEEVKPNPFIFAKWLENLNENSKFVFDENHQMKVQVLKSGEHKVGLDNAEVWIYQLVRKKSLFQILFVTLEWNNRNQPKSDFERTWFSIDQTKRKGQFDGQVWSFDGYFTACCTRLIISNKLQTLLISFSKLFKKVRAIFLADKASIKVKKMLFKKFRCN